MPGESADMGDVKEEEVVRREECALVHLMDCVSGRLEITTQHIFFHANEGEGPNGKLLL